MELERPVFADRSARGKIRVTGPQRAWFLDQILTQRLDDIAPGEARPAAMLTVHGRMTAYLEAVATDEAILCHFEPDLRPTFPDELRKYVFATRVEIDDVTDDYGLVLVAGPGWRDVVADLSDGGVVHPTASLGVDAAYLWTDSATDLVERFAAAGLEPAEDAALEAIRIANGVPRWGFEMDNKTLPQEVGVDATAVHYEKGCYLGQEAMAKIHFRGKVNRRLVRLEASNELRRGTELFADDAKVGAVTSAAGPNALAIVRHTVEPGTVLRAGDREAKVVG